MNQAFHVLSDLGQSAKPTPTRAMAPFIAKLEKEGAWLVGGAIGQPDEAPRADAALAIVRHVLSITGYNAVRGSLGENTADTMFDLLSMEPPTGRADGYPAFEGTLEQRQIIAEAEQRRFGTTLSITPQHICMTAGGSNGLFMAFAGLCNKRGHERGDVLVFLDPYFPVYDNMAALLDIETDTVSCIGTKFRPNMAGLEQKITDLKAAGKNPILVLQSPSNPTGYAFTRQEWEQLATLVNTHSIMVIGDDIYRRICQDPISLLDIDPTLLTRGQYVALDCVSKAGGAPGWRSGHILAHPDIIRQLAPLNLSSGVIFGNSLGTLGHAADMSVDHHLQTAAHYRGQAQDTVNLLTENNIIRFPHSGDSFYAIAQFTEAKGKPVNANTEKTLRAIATDLEKFGIVIPKEGDITIENDFLLMADLLFGYGVRSIPLASSSRDPAAKEMMGVRLVLTGGKQSIEELGRRCLLYKEVQLGKAESPKSIPALDSAPSPHIRAAMAHKESPDILVGFAQMG
ncbi:MAG: aminotransferase class I/II-fold pyridoxal phosphate-dependent enzyme [Alphaproteobacteria bacterium]|nr:aminotransferase class I/II-fold pyridoxal phosphate-dependent enzyme [Alphaproteobacteria bacterium]